MDDQEFPFGGWSGDQGQGTNALSVLLGEGSPPESGPFSAFANSNDDWLNDIGDIDELQVPRDQCVPVIVRRRHC